MSGQAFYKVFSEIVDDVGFVFDRVNGSCALKAGGREGGKDALLTFLSNPISLPGWNCGAECELFVSVFSALVRDGKVNLSEQIEKAMSLRMNNVQLREVLDEINERYILRSGLEITSHGLLRSFRFWSDDEKRRYVAEVCGVMDSLRDVSGAVCLGYGAVLSLQRSGDLSPHDDDLDVLVGFDISEVHTFGMGVKLLREALQTKGYQVGNAWPAFLKVRAKGMSCDIDVFVVLNELGKLASIPGPRGVIPWEAVFPSGLKSFMGIDIPVPAKPEIYLEHVYGGDWRVPKRGWQHSWNYAKYEDIT